MKRGHPLTLIKIFCGARWPEISEELIDSRLGIINSPELLKFIEIALPWKINYRKLRFRSRERLEEVRSESILFGNAYPDSISSQSSLNRRIHASEKHFFTATLSLALILLKSSVRQRCSCGCQQFVNHLTARIKKCLFYDAICDTVKCLISMSVGLRITRRRRRINLATLLPCSHYVQRYDSISMRKRLFGMNINCENGHEYCKRFCVLKEQFHLVIFRLPRKGCDGI